MKFSSAITPDLPKSDSPVMEDEHLDTIPETESDELIKSSVEDLVHTPSESDGISEGECDLPVCDDSSLKKDEKSSGNPTSRSDYSLTDHEVFYFDDDHIEENSSGSTTTHSDSSLYKYDSFIFDLSIDPFPPADRSDVYHEQFAGELAHIISPPEYDHFYFKIEPELGNLTMDVVEDIFDKPTREPRVHVPNILLTHPTLHLDLDYILSSDSLFAYVVWIFLPFLTYPVSPSYLLSTGNEDTIFDPDIPIYHSFMPDFIFHLLLHGPMNSGSSQACDSVNKNKALRGWQPMLILVVLMNKCFVVVRRLAFSISRVLCCNVRIAQDFDASVAHGVLRSQELHILSFIWEI
ncbi:hypothetical protein Tco_0947471 [Tanacetum coccineum]